MTQWTTIDGRTWSITIGDKTAQVWLWLDNTTYGTCIWQINNAPTTLTCLDTYDDIKLAKKACLDEIERIDAYEAQQAQEAEEASAMFRESDPNIDDGMPA